MPTSTLSQSPAAPTERVSNATDGLRCRPTPFERIARDAWDRLYAESASATPFARWTFHRAWWDAYGSTAHEQYLVCADDSSEIRGIVPLMHRHEEEPEDERTATVLRRLSRQGTHVRADAKAIFFGASYHADYATLLCAPDDLESTAMAMVESLAAPPHEGHGDQPWDVVDLRRLRTRDPAVAALEAAFGLVRANRGWEVVREVEDVCPVVTVEAGAGWDDYLASLGKKARHEIRRKLRRGQAAGGLGVELAAPTARAVDEFIALHQKRFGDEGLFPPTEGGERSRQFVKRLAELELAEGESGQLQVAQVRSGERLIFSALAFDDGQTCYFYNAGMDPDAAELSPGITGTAEYLRDRIEAGRRRFDFMRGSEPYKYEWGARDELIERLLVLRGAGA